MSDTKPNTSKAALRDMIVADANSVPDLISKAEKADPDLAASLTAKALIGSKSIWAPLATAIVSWAVTRYGIAFDPDTSTLVSGLLAWLASVVCRYFTRAPIGGIVTVPAAPLA